MLKRILLKVQYKGTDYHGWQLQADHITIQEHLTKALQQVTQSKISMTACSRTDAGVHALGQIASTRVHVDTDLKSLHYGINSLIPKDIRVIEIVDCDLHYDPRKVHNGKRYFYNLFVSPVDSAFDSPYHWWFRKPFDLELLLSAAKKLEGKHDFKAFRGRNCLQEKTVKTIFSVELITTKKDLGIEYKLIFEGDGFLQNMIRIFVGTLVDIANSKLKADILDQEFSSLCRSDLGITAPPRGLFLEKIFLNPDPFQTN